MDTPGPVYRRYIEKHYKRWLSRPNINSIGVGKKTIGEVEQEAFCLQFTVNKKHSTGNLRRLRQAVIPEFIEFEGEILLTDIEQQCVDPDDGGGDDSGNEFGSRSAFQHILQPGLSISHWLLRAGTITAIVQDNQNGETGILSSWHVIHGKRGDAGDRVIQPGRPENRLLNGINDDTAASLQRGYLGVKGDGAFASIRNDLRAFSKSIYGIDLQPTSTGRAQIGDVVCKSGRTTGVTYGRVRRINVFTRVKYRGGRSQVISGFDVVGDAERNGNDGLLSEPGDSGAPYLLCDPETQKPSSTLVGMHVAGDTNPNREIAFVGLIDEILQKLDVSIA